MAVAAIWAPALVFAHLFAFFWLFKALVLTRPRQKTNKQKETASSSSDHLAASPAKSQAVLKQSQPVLLEWQVSEAAKRAYTATTAAGSHQAVWLVRSHTAVTNSPPAAKLVEPGAWLQLQPAWIAHQGGLARRVGPGSARADAGAGQCRLGRKASAYSQCVWFNV